MLQWFAVHGTSLNNTNTLISGDNKGLAAQLFERSHAGSESKASIVAAFCQSNVGDTSPNTRGAFCIDSDAPCAEDSTCGTENERCHGRGPEWPDDFASNAVIAGMQADHLKAQVSDGANKMRVSGPVDYRHTFVDMSKVDVVESSFTRAGKTCLPAMGVSFGAGTTDGPGAFDFHQVCNTCCELDNIIQLYRVLGLFD